MDSHSDYEEDWQSDLDLSSRGSHLLWSGLWADVQFAVGEEEEVIDAHRLVLASASPVFAAMLYGPLAEEKSPIRVPDVTLEVFNLLLEFIYTDMIEEVTVEKLPEIEDVSKKYLIPHLMEACGKTLTKNLSPKNAIQCYEFATANENKPLIDACVKVFNFYPTLVFESESILDAKTETIEFIFSQDYLSINSEFDLFTVVEKYAKVNENKKIEGDTHTRCIRRLLQHIRFLTLEGSELAKQHQRIRAFLTESELLSLLININCADAAPMPEGFATSRICRRITVPVIQDVSGKVAVGRVFTIVGIVYEDAERFHINLLEEKSSWDAWRNESGWDTTILFHISVQFYDQYDENVDVVVRNTYGDAAGEREWGREEREGGMPFVPGEPFELTIKIESDRFKVCVNGDFFCYYAHRLPFERIRYLNVTGDVELNYLA